MEHDKISARVFYITDDGIEKKIMASIEVSRLFATDDDHQSPRHRCLTRDCRFQPPHRVAFGPYGALTDEQACSIAYRTLGEMLAHTDEEIAAKFRQETDTFLAAEGWGHGEAGT